MMSGMKKTPNHMNPSCYMEPAVIMGGEMPGLCLASWKHTSKVMGGLFASWGPDDWLAKTSNSEETHPGDDSSDTREATNNYGCEHLWKGTEIRGTLWV